MAEYIRKEDASNWLKQYGQDVLHGKYKFSLMYIWKNIMDLPPADVAPVVHGRWIKEYRAKGQVANMCTECGGETGRASKFCPNCGAKMDGKREE